MMQSVKKNPDHNLIWSYVAGFIAGMGSAMGALAFQHIPFVELGAVVAGIFGLIAAATAFYVFGKKIKNVVLIASLLGFLTPPMLVVILFLEVF